jgi:hypothetical protein
MTNDNLVGAGRKLLNVWRAADERSVDLNIGTGRLGNNVHGGDFA